MVACAPEQLDTLEPGLHLDKKFVCQAVEAVKHANWFEIEASGRFSRFLKAKERVCFAGPSIEFQ